MLTIDCKIVSVSLLKDPERISVKIIFGGNKELMCSAHRLLYGQAHRNVGQWVYLKIDLQTVFIDAFGPQQYSNRFVIRSIVPHNELSQIPKMDW